MKTRKILLLSLVVVSLVLAGVFLVALRDANERLTEQTGKAVRLEGEVVKLKQELGKFDGVQRSDLLRVCTDKASTAYSDYIKNNSISSTEGNVTTFMPKSSDILRRATETLDASKKSCTDKFGG